MKSDYRVAQRIGVPWEPDYVKWMFDTDLIPPDRRRQLLEHFGANDHDLLRQDWNAAERLAVKVGSTRTDLGWVYDVAGWAAERRGDVAAAIAQYAQGIRPSLFSDHTVTFRTHWIADGFAKFSVARLFDLRESVRERVLAHWLEAAHLAESTGDWSAAYDAYFNAGWDLGLDQIGAYGEILAGLARAARARGAVARAAIAEMHASCLP